MSAQKYSEFPDEGIITISDSVPEESTLQQNLSSPRISAIGKSDKPAKQDFLDREIYVAAIAALIQNRKTQAPLTIGIYGPWGSGKSSFLSQLTERLPKQNRVANFNPWRLSGGGEVWAGLVSEIAPIVDRHLGLFQRIRFLFILDPTRSIGKMHTRIAAAGKKVGNWLIVATASGGYLAPRYLQRGDISDFLNTYFTSNDRITELLRGWLANAGIDDFSKVRWDTVVSECSLIILIVFALYKVTKVLLRPFSTQFEANMTQFKDDSQELKNTTFKDFEALRKIIGDFTSGQAKRHKPHLVLMIDDLDRCAPDRVVSVLEAVNSFIAELPIITVIAIDTKFVCNAVAARHRFLFAPEDGIDARERYGRLFLEKIIHVPFQLPAVRSYERYIEELLTISADAMQVGEANDEQRNVALLPGLADLLETREGYQKAFIVLVGIYLRIVFILLKPWMDTDDRWRVSFALRLSCGVALTAHQRQWLASQDLMTQINFRVLESENSRSNPLFSKLTGPFRVFTHSLATERNL
jgi:hypothetical protein